MDDKSLLWLAINAYHEARGESYSGQVAVCQVVLNRCLYRQMAVKDIVLQDKQFSWANGGDMPKIKDYTAFESCVKAAHRAIELRMQGDCFHGADHYYSVDIPPPAWVNDDMVFLGQIGKHRFYRFKYSRIY